jgi:hypothetical protein
MKNRLVIREMQLKSPWVGLDMWYKTFVNATKYPQHNNKKKKNHQKNTLYLSEWSFKKTQIRAGKVVEVVEGLPSRPEALS